MSVDSEKRKKDEKPRVFSVKELESVCEPGMMELGKSQGCGKLIITGDFFLSSKSSKMMIDTAVASALHSGRLEPGYKTLRAWL